MSQVIQNLLVLAAVGGSIAFIFRSAFNALKGRKSAIGGCGTCSGCATAPAPTTKALAERTVMVPLDALIRTRKR